MTDSRGPIHRLTGAPAALGPVGITARVLGGLLLIGLALFWWDPTWGDAVFGLIVLPAVVVGLLALRARRSPAPLRATGPLGHLLNALMFVPLLVLPATAGGAALFYGASMIVAATRRGGGCEVTAISNTLLERDDEVGCMIFAPVDIIEARLRRAASTSGAR
jgi:hypothetical protein